MQLAQQSGVELGDAVHRDALRLLAGERVVLAGDHLDTPSIQGALVSGGRAAATVARMLRAAHRREQGLPNAPVLERMLVTFLRSMAESDAVVHYDPELEDGFVRVKRRPGVDDHPLIRRDDLDDDGRPVRRTAV